MGIIEKNKTELPQVMEGELKARLIKLREDAGYDTAQMSDVLCLSENVIINLENEAIDKLPQPAYVRGYLRNYAKLGDEDPEELIRRYEALRGSDAAELDYQIKPSTTISTSPQRSMMGIWSQLILLAVLLIGIALFSTIPSVKSWVTNKWDSFSTQLSQPSDASGNPSLTGDLPVPSPLANEAIIDAKDAASQNVLEIKKSTETSIISNLDNTSSILDSISNPDSSALNLNLDEKKEEIENVINETSQALAEEVISVDTTNTITEEKAPEANANQDSLLDSTQSSNTTDETTLNTDQTQLDTTETPLNLNTESDTFSDLLTSIEDKIDNVEETVTDENTLITENINEQVNVKLVFNAEVWLRIKNKEDKTVFEGLNTKGSDKTIDLIKPLKFRVGNAKDLNLFIDNKAVDISSFINGSIANFTIE